MDIHDLHNQFCEYQATIRNMQPNTILNYKTSKKLFCKLLPHIQTIEQVGYHDVNQFFYIGRSERNWKPITFITHHKNLAVFFKWCMKHKYLGENPMKDIEKPRLERKLLTRLSKQLILG